MNKFLAGLLRWLLVISMPVFLVLTVARLFVGDWYPRYEYNKADFPADSYGFTKEQRLEYAQVAIHYLNSPLPPEQAISMLTSERLPGTDLPLYHPAEISHMLDVKRLMDQLWRVEVFAGIVVAAALTALLARRETRPGGYWALMVSGIFTLALLVGLGVFVLVGWNTFFVEFHEVFFSPGTWTFDWSDTLIRLFPDKFWFDAGVLIVASSLAAGLIVAFAGNLLWQRAPRPAGRLPAPATGDAVSR